MKVRRTTIKHGSAGEIASSLASCAVGRAASIEYCARHSAVASNKWRVGVVCVKSTSR